MQAKSPAAAHFFAHVLTMFSKIQAKSQAAAHTFARVLMMRSRKYSLYTSKITLTIKLIPQFCLNRFYCLDRGGVNMTAEGQSFYQVIPKDQEPSPIKEILI